VVNINTDVNAAMHYGKTTALVGDAALTLEGLNKELAKLGPKGDNSEWFAACKTKRKEWDKARHERYNNPTIYDKVWQREVLSQPAAIKTAVDWAKDNEAVNFFDAGDVQANGFQVVEDDRPGQTFTDTGASYMGFAVSALLATAMTDKPFYGIAYTGDGSFTMNPQVLIDGSYHGATGCILLLDNRRMAAISALQMDQYEEEHATKDDVAVDYVQWARSVAGIKAIHGGYTPAELRRALDEAKAHNGLTLIHVPVYYGGDPMGGLGVYGRWNVGNWVHEAQAIRHNIGL
jgi:3D-(3,5/4)-trihydroxycyclohexane-1,2-dione acylhydrolase (decyclizing)